jgi:hypothetical protein
MQIITTQHKTPDNYSIKDVEITGVEGPRGNCCLAVRVSLEPSRYLRRRGDGWSGERKKNGARELIVTHEELQQMIGTLKGELDRCYEFLAERDLLTEFYRATESAASPA